MPFAPFAGTKKVPTKDRKATVSIEKVTPLRRHTVHREHPAALRALFLGSAVLATHIPYILIISMRALRALPAGLVDGTGSMMSASLLLHSSSMWVKDMHCCWNMGKWSRLLCLFMSAAIGCCLKNNGQSHRLIIDFVISADEWCSHVEDQ